MRVVPSLRGEACRTLLGELSPDYLLVYGTEIVKPETFQLASRGALNLHTGISPRYRGADCGFWALHNEEPEWIGSTVHMLDAGIDTGPILATVRPSIEASDDEHTLFAKCVRVGADTYVQSIEALRAGDGGARPQALSEGREYRSVDRTLRADLRVARLLRGGLLARYLERDDHPPA